ncbi:MAG: biotin carboxylase N-terminal domain-containing protein [Litoreibacter sp.]
MFNKILIANRGEIACRVIDTCNKMGVQTVAVHSDIDAQARHVTMADEAVSLGGKTPAQSYLRIDAVIDAALACKAEAIHPGYGFLSENPEFVEAVEAAGLIFIGPSAPAIRAMGLKDAAKALMIEAGVPVVPGYHGAAQDDLAARADEIGYPVLIKAVAGGGGKGMRLVDEAGSFEDALEMARSEAISAFGNGSVLIEKFVDKPRHIEVQIFGDGKTAVHLFERDCSLQRRHQKVIEEAPAPGMTAEMRHAMGAAAVAAAEAVGYAGAGTVEFIVDASEGLRVDRFYFMEMNTRLQVEHPVTEAITGVDLVEWQLRVAAGEGLPCAQQELSITGHAFEARLYAEDVPAGFLPATGSLEHLRFGRARVDTGVRQGDEISPFYDPMIAKLTVHGQTRSEALKALDDALAGTQIAGTVTNIAFLKALGRHSGFADGDVDTGLIERDLLELSKQPVPCTRCQSIAAITALDLADVSLAGFTLWAPLRHRVALNNDEAEFEAYVCVLGRGKFEVTLGDVAHHVEFADRWVVDGVTVGADSILTQAGVSVFWGNTYHFVMPDPLERRTDVGGDDVTRAPMPGQVKSVFVTPGKRVQAGDRLVILEAMKMEHTLRAHRDGVVAEVNVSDNSQVAAGDVIVSLEAE